jgi:peptide-methionine (S)-S-oxide reductase
MQQERAVTLPKNSQQDQRGRIDMSADIILAGGCFWCTEAVFKSLAGVIDVESGYIGGEVDNPTYRQVCEGTTGHAEAIKVHYDPSIINRDELLDVFFATHDPTQLNRQGNDVGTQYRSAMFPADDEENSAMSAAISRAQTDWPLPIVTTIEPRSRWWPAEGYHQDFWNGEGQRNPYCMAVIPPKLAKLRKGFAAKLATDSTSD